MKLQANNQKIKRNCSIYRGLYKRFKRIYIRNHKKRIWPEPGRVSEIAER